LFLLVIAASAVVVAFALGRDADHAADETVARFVCPMHREVTTTRPGECPICRMPLEPIAGATPVVTSRAGALGFDTLRRRIFLQDVRAPAWVKSDRVVVAVVYKDKLATLLPREPGRFAPSTAPDASVAVRLGEAPPAPWDEATVQVELELDDAAATLTAGDVGWVRMEAKPRQLPVLPAGAILQSPAGPYVLVDAVDHRELLKRAVQLGHIFGDFAVVLAGVDSGERVLVRDAFFFDAERRLQRAPGQAGEP
jgi:hypothetical protein